MYEICVENSIKMFVMKVWSGLRKISSVYNRKTYDRKLWTTRLKLPYWPVQQSIRSIMFNKCLKCQSQTTFEVTEKGRYLWLDHMATVYFHSKLKHKKKWRNSRALGNFILQEVSVCMYWHLCWLLASGRLNLGDSKKF